MPQGVHRGMLANLGFVQRLLHHRLHAPLVIRAAIATFKKVFPWFILVMGISKNTTYPSLLEKGKGVEVIKERFLEMPL